MVERFGIVADENGDNVWPILSGEWVRHSDYARLQEQVEALRKERDDVGERGDHWRNECADWQTRAEAAEAERDRLRADVARFMDELGPRWFLERNWFPSSLQKEPHPAQERDDGR